MPGVFSTYFRYVLLFLGGSVLIGLFGHVSTNTVAHANEAILTRVTGEYDYEIIKHEAEVGEPKEVLLIYSLADTGTPDYAAERARINDFVQIIASHWNTHIVTKNYLDITAADIQQYSHFIFIEQYDREQAVRMFSDIVRRPDKKTLWIGCGSYNSTRGLLRKPEPSRIINAKTIDSVIYKEVPFEVNEYFSICAPLPAVDGVAEYEVLATYIDMDDVEHPLIGKFDSDHLYIPHQLPSTYDISNYSLPFLDVFHHFLGHHPVAAKHPALFRLEDVNPHTYNNPVGLNRVHSYLRDQGIPFHIAYIVNYRDPLNNVFFGSNDSIRFLNSIKEMVNTGNAILVQHGHTHQVKNEVSGVGFEFWDDEHNRPLTFDSTSEMYAYPFEVIYAAREAMLDAGLPIPDIWETPHYAFNRIDNEVFNHTYPIRYEHIQDIGSLPFVAKIDDTVFLPENLGYIFGGPEELAEKELRLQQLRAFENPVASGFWHPWRELEELEAYTSLIEKYGFEFVTAYDLLDKKGGVSSTELAVSNTRIYTENFLIYLVLSVFTFGIFAYLRNVIRVRRYMSQIDRYDIHLDEVIKTARQHGSALPVIALFIPARNEGLVIENTIRRIAKLDYLKEKLRVYVITDEREHDDDVPETTIAVAERTAAELHKASGHAFIHVIEVPKWYSGVYGSVEKTYARSTKGRALNYCLQNVNVADVDVIGVLDADGRLHANVLKEVAIKRVTYKRKVLQGPVFQVNNFKDVTIVGVAAGLELALHHLTELPHRLHKENTLQFLAGTNYFIETKSIQEAGGWDQYALVEDAELALRLYLKDGTVGDWLNSPEVEQTPPNFGVYLKQRERWVRGHLDLVPVIHRSKLAWHTKLYLYYKLFIAQFRFIIDVGIPVLAIALMFTGVLAYTHPVFWYFSIFLLIGSIFIWDTYGYMYRTLKEYIDPEMPIRQKLFWSVKLVLFLPVFIIIQAIPRVKAIYKYFFQPETNSWYKTERTAETVVR